ncbi:MAG: hypothetical protein QHJ73_12090, partial [Armatimonadota bacterium]|nr:hypothetical protein [Armatimonadota bacterium]
VKLGAGSIRDVEFVVQYLQLAYVSQFPQIRTRATLKALPRLRAAGTRVVSAYGKPGGASCARTPPKPASGHCAVLRKHRGQRARSAGTRG